VQVRLAYHERVSPLSSLSRCWQHGAGVVQIKVQMKAFEKEGLVQVLAAMMRCTNRGI